jgi:uncharacterized caspase-like protein
LRLTIGRELCLPPSQIPLYWRTGRCGRAFARRFCEPKFNKLPSVGASIKNLSASGVSQDDLLRAMRGVYGKAILFLDTCHANQAVASAAGTAARGPVDVISVINELAKAENGLVVFSSSQGRETSQESAEWRHGAFTKALIEGVGLGKADLLHKGAITVSELDAYVAERVKELTEAVSIPS